jgi:hypothetical protein
VSTSTRDLAMGSASTATDWLRNCVTRTPLPVTQRSLPARPASVIMVVVPMTLTVTVNPTLSAIVTATAMMTSASAASVTVTSNGVVRARVQPSDDGNNSRVSERKSAQVGVMHRSGRRNRKKTQRRTQGSVKADQPKCGAPCSSAAEP